MTPTTISSNGNSSKGIQTVKQAQIPILLVATLIWGTLLWGCSSAPVLEQGLGIRTEVTILTGGFVRFEEQRVPMETFQLEMRRRVRQADGEPTLLPMVVLDVEEGVGSLTGQAMVQRLMDGLRASGVRYINLEDA